MAMTSGNGCRGGLLSDINVTPLVDVMLVLLIIFMVTAPMMTRGVAVELPETTAKALPQEQHHTQVSVTADGQIYIGEVPVDEQGLISQLKTIKQERKKVQIIIRADKRVSYGKVAKLIAAIQQAGINKIGLVSRPEEIDNINKR